MTTTQGIVAAVFDDRAQAEQAVNALENSGFSDDQIRFVGHGGSSGGGILDTLKSVFTGQETGSVYNDLVSMGVAQDAASYFQQEYEAGHSIVAVLAGERMQEATGILTRYGGYSANQRVGQTTAYDQTSDYAQTSDYGQRSSATQTTEYAQSPGTAGSEYATGTEGEQRLKLREEELRAQKQPVQTGEARLRKDVVTEEKSIEVPVTREEVYVERRPGSGQPADEPIGEGETYRIPVREEQVTVEKQPYVREEVAMGKRAVQETQQVTDTVRREEARVERAGDVNIQGSDVQDAYDQPDQTTP